MLTSPSSHHPTSGPAPPKRPSPAEAVQQLAEVLAGIGFSPEVQAEGRGYRICLRDCPFREVAQHHQNIVCSLHFGLMQGTLSQLRAPLTAERLQPFARPGECIAEVTGYQEASAHDA